MILLNLIKKEVIEFFRNKSNVIIMLIFPVILIAVMGKALNGLMSMDKNIFNDKIIYYRVNPRITNEEDLQRLYDFMIHFEKGTNVRFVENKNYDEVTKAVNNNEAICFMDIHDGSINYFRNEKKESTESKVFRNIYEQYMRKYTFLQSMSKSNPNQMQNILDYEIKILLKNEGINEKEVNSFTYYTFAELSLIILYISTLTLTSMYRERLLHTMTRLKVSNIKRVNIIISKIVLGIIVGILQILMVYIVSTSFFYVNWGKNLIYIFIVLISLVIFSSVLGIFISMIFSDKKTGYAVNNVLIIVMGFLGGSYVPICLVKSAKVTNFLCEIMPNYWTNMATLGLNYNIETKYYIISIFISLTLSVLMLIIGNFISKLKVGGGFD